MEIQNRTFIHRGIITAICVLCMGAVFFAFNASPAFAGSKGAPKKTTIKVTTVGSTELKVTIKQVKGAGGYMIYRAKSKNGFYEKVRTVKAGTKTYTDTGLKGSTKYFYKVKAFKNVKGKKKYSGYSNIASAKTKVRPDGNGPKYSLQNIRRVYGSDLEGETIYFLGSSITLGKGSEEQSFVEVLEKKYGMNVKKSAVNGTTLVGNHYDPENVLERVGLVNNSYVCRLERDFGELEAPDYLVCQLSSNDAKKNKPLGDIAAGTDPAGFDTKTIAGSIEFITAYAKEKWNCPVIFFTNTRFADKVGYENQYIQMQKMLQRLSQKWGDQLLVLDLWNLKSAQLTSTDDRILCMKDSIHPTKAGYINKYVPAFEKFLLAHPPVPRETTPPEQEQEPQPGQESGQEPGQEPT